MKVIDVVRPVIFKTGQALPPEDINKVFLYAQDVVSDVAEKRFAICPVVLPFIRDMAAGVSNASSATMLTYRFVSPVRCTIQRAFFDGNLVSADRVNLDVVITGGSVRPVGATTPYLSVEAQADVAVDCRDINVQHVQLEAGVNYSFVLSGTSFTTSRADLILHLAVDRWNLAGQLEEPNFNPILYRDEECGSDNITDNLSDLDFSRARFNTLRAMTCIHLWASNFHSTTNALNLAQLIASMSNGRARGRIRQITMTSGTVVAGTVTATLRNAANVVVNTLSNVHAAAGIVTGTNAALAIPLAGDASVPAQDLNLTFSTTIATPSTCERASVLIWVEWV